MLNNFLCNPWLQQNWKYLRDPITLLLQFSFSCWQQSSVGHSHSVTYWTGITSWPLLVSPPWQLTSFSATEGKGFCVDDLCLADKIVFMCTPDLVYSRDKLAWPVQVQRKKNWAERAELRYSPITSLSPLLESWGAGVVLIKVPGLFTHWIAAFP